VEDFTPDPPWDWSPKTPGSPHRAGTIGIEPDNPQPAVRLVAEQGVEPCILRL